MRQNIWIVFVLALSFSFPHCTAVVADQKKGLDTILFPGEQEPKGNHGKNPAKRIPRVRIYDARENKGPVICEQGDLIQISFTFRIDSDEIIANLRVQIKGEGLTEIGVFQVPIDDRGKTRGLERNISAFLKAEKPGRPVVNIAEIDEKGATRPQREFKIVIASPR